MQARTTSKPIAYLVALTLIIGASQLLMSAKTFANESAECPCVSEDCPYGAIDDCFDDLDPYGLPPPFGSAPGAPVRPRPPVATSHATLDQATRTARYTVDLTPEGINRYGRLNTIEISQRSGDGTANISIEGRDQHINKYVWQDQLSQMLGLQTRLNFTISADGLSAYAEVRYFRSIPLIEATRHGVRVDISLLDLDVRTQNTGDITHTLRSRRSRARSALQDIE